MQLFDNAALTNALNAAYGTNPQNSYYGGAAGVTGYSSGAFPVMGGVNPAGASGGYSAAPSYSVPSYAALPGSAPQPYSAPSGSPASTAGTPFSLNPTPTQGSGTTYGMVPGAIGAPPSVWQQEQSIPGMAGATSQETGLISSELAGKVSPGTTTNLTNAAAARGMALGQGGGTGLTNQILLNTLGLTSEGLQQQGSQNYLSFLSQSGSQQQNPQLLADIASRNAAMAAAPNPTLAAEQAIALGQGTGRVNTPPRHSLPSTSGASSASPVESSGSSLNASGTPMEGINQRDYDATYGQGSYAAALSQYTNPATGQYSAPASGLYTRGGNTYGQSGGVDYGSPMTNQSQTSDSSGGGSDSSGGGSYDQDFEDWYSGSGE